MTVYPFQFHFGAFVVTGYGIMMMVAFLVAGWAMARQTERAGMDPAIAWDTVVCGVVGGLLGAKIYYAVLVGRWEALLSRGGLVWYGGFIGGFIAVVGYWWWKKLPVRRLMDLIAPSMAIGYCLGRIGCFLVNDDYGRPTDVPWAMAFPQGAPPTTAQVLRTQFHIAIPPEVPATQVLAVHPTQLYEAFIAFGMFWLLWRLRERPRGAGWLFGVYLVLAGCERAFVEIFRAKDDRIFGPMSIAQVVSMGVILAGVWMITSARKDPLTAAPLPG